jgi:hypothetical protein
MTVDLLEVFKHFVFSMVMRASQASEWHTMESLSSPYSSILGNFTSENPMTVSPLAVVHAVTRFQKELDKVATTYLEMFPCGTDMKIRAFGSMVVLMRILFVEHFTAVSTGHMVGTCEIAYEPSTMESQTNPTP